MALHSMLCWWFTVQSCQQQTSLSASFLFGTTALKGLVSRLLYPPTPPQDHQLQRLPIMNHGRATCPWLYLLQGTHGFTLDPLLGEFMLTHPNIKIPTRGQIYSVNDARYFDCEPTHCRCQRGGS